MMSKFDRKRLARRCRRQGHNWAIISGDGFTYAWNVYTGEVFTHMSRFNLSIETIERGMPVHKDKIIRFLVTSDGSPAWLMSEGNTGIIRPLDWLDTEMLAKVRVYT